MKKTILLTLSLAFLGMLPAMAQLGKVWVDFQDYAIDLQAYLETNITQTLVPLNQLPQDVIKQSNNFDPNDPIDIFQGGLGIPDPYVAENLIRSDIMTNPLLTRFEDNPLVRATAASNEFNRQTTRSVVQNVLSRAGQIRSRAKLETIETNLDSNDTFVNNVKAQSQSLLDKLLDPLCQTYFKNATVIPINRGVNTSLCENSALANLQFESLKIQRDQAKMAGETLAYTIQENQSQQYSNLNLANISQQMEEANRARRVDASAEAARLLRATSQARFLLGVRNLESEVRRQESE